jgi:predicted permease
MRKIRALWIRLCGLLRRPQGDGDFETELASHLAMHTDDGIRAGLSSEEARRQALIRLGGAEQTRQAYRDRRGLPWLETLARDLAYSLRRLVRRPAMTAIAVFSIGLGLGANATIFSMVSRFVPRPAPVGDPSTLLAIQRRGENALSWPLFNDLREQVKSISGVAARPGPRWSLRNLLTVAQIAMSVILLSMTGLFLRSLETAVTIDLGFRPQDLLSMSVDPRLHGYTPERTVEFLNQLRERVAALPGVVSAACTDFPPLSMAGDMLTFHVGGRSDSGKDNPVANLTRVTPDYFETMGIPRVAGRDFGGETASGPKTAVVNRAFVERLFAGENPIGQQVTGGGVTYQIVGVVGNVKTTSLGEDLKPVLYRSLEQNVGTDPNLLGYTLVVHTAGHPAAMSEAVRRQIHALDPSMAVFNEETMEEHVHSAFFLPRLAATLFSVFGAIGLVLATVGLYGVMSYAVSRRTREIGIRMAMGAQPGTVERQVLRQGLVLTLIAVALGWPAAWMLSKLAASFLYGIHPHDALTFALVPPFLASIALVACWVPARRAASIEPMQALRTE